jgi:hypothetical protein
MAQEIRLDGRDFEGVSQRVTAAQDDYLLYWLGQSGAHDLLTRLASGKQSEKTAKDLLATMLGSGMVHHILAGVLTERGKKWRRDEAERNAEIFSDITDTDEKVAMRKCIVDFVIGFFRSGEVSSTTSPKSSNPTEADPDTESADQSISEVLPQSSVK